MPNTPDLTQMNIAVPPDLARRIRVLAAANDLTTGTVVVIAMSLLSDDVLREILADEARYRAAKRAGAI